jgi:hypothetical protein
MNKFVDSSSIKFWNTELMFSQNMIQVNIEVDNLVGYYLKRRMVLGPHLYNKLKSAGASLVYMACFPIDH